MSAGEERGGYRLCVSPHYAWMQKVFSAVPGARGYLAREKMREADILIRRYVAARLDEAVAEVEAARQSIASAGASAWLAAAAGMPMIGAQPLAGGLQSLLPGLSDLANRLRLLSSSILYADSGWAPVSAVQAIREAELERLCSYDDTMIGLSEAILALSRRLRSAVQGGDAAEAQRLLGEALDAVSKLQGLYEERRAWLTFASRQQGPGLGERLRGALGSALEAARSALSRLTRMLGLRP